MAMMINIMVMPMGTWFLTTMMMMMMMTGMGIG